MCKSRQDRQGTHAAQTVRVAHQAVRLGSAPTFPTKRYPRDSQPKESTTNRELEHSRATSLQGVSCCLNLNLDSAFYELRESLHHDPQLLVRGNGCLKVRQKRVWGQRNLKKT